MGERTRIDSRLIVAYQGGEHRILEHGCIVLEGDTIIYVGRADTYNGQVDHVIDASDQIITPGFINTHTHLSESPLDKSFVEDRGHRQFSMSGLAEMLPARGAAIDEAARHAAIDYSMAELIRTGTTTVMEIGGHGDYTADAVARSGLRGYIANGYRSGRWLTRDGKKMEYEWDEAAGTGGLAAGYRVHRAHGWAGQRARAGLSLPVAGGYLHGGTAAPEQGSVGPDAGATGIACQPVRVRVR